jgi:hypothetical protein
MSAPTSLRSSLEILIATLPSGAVDAFFYGISGPP